jgi:uncharacterized membrane protein
MDQRLIKKVIIVAIALLGLLTILEGYQILFRNASPKYSELGILGPGMKIGDYPTDVRVGENITLYTYVGNHEGKTQNYTILVKIGNQNMKVNNSTPMNAPIIGQINLLIPDGGDQTSPTTIIFEKAELHQKLVFELWSYSSDSGEIVYSGIWAQININVRI